MHLGLLPNLSACMIGMLLEPPIVAITHYVMWFSSRLNWNLHSASRTINRMALLLHRAVQWHYIDELSNDTVPNHTFIYNQSPSSIYLQSNYNYGMISGAFAQKCASAHLAQCHWTALCIIIRRRVSNIYSFHDIAAGRWILPVSMEMVNLFVFDSLNSTLSDELLMA